MWNHVKDSREEAKMKSTKYKRNIIPFGRIITDLLVHTRLVGDLEKAGFIKDPFAMCGSSLNAHTLTKMDLIETIASTPSVDHAILTKKSPALADFELFLKNEHPNIVVSYLKLCKEQGSAYDPVWISNRQLFTIVDLIPETEEQKKKKKRKKEHPEGRKEMKKKKENKELPKVQEENQEKGKEKKEEKKEE
ncbi:nucleolar protein 58-like [Vicia villosa]|uniref:nucleolar protein 58-like n=1 Tax=Vicia villosa TaxID=3911 RepID=UPI00273B0E7C|nr:nucleolar protein 58-like [Vicia villosa]